MLVSTKHRGGKRGIKETDHEKGQRNPAYEVGNGIKRSAGRLVSANLRIAHSTVGDYVRYAEQVGLDWAQVQEFGEPELKS